MKAGALICITIVLCVSMLQDVSGGKIVSEKKLKRWTEKNKDVNKKDINIKTVHLERNKAFKKHENELQDLLEVIQYVITDAINNQEFRTFMIKRFLHNYVPQGDSINRHMGTYYTVCFKHFSISGEYHQDIDFSSIKSQMIICTWDVPKIDSYRGLQDDQRSFINPVSGMPWSCLASEYLDKIKDLKMKMDPKAAQEDNEKDEVMKNH